MSFLFGRANKTKIPEVTEFQCNLIRAKSLNPECAGPDVYRRINIPNEAFHQFSAQCLTMTCLEGRRIFPSEFAFLGSLDPILD